MGLHWANLGKLILSLFVVGAPLGASLGKSWNADFVAICGSSWGFIEQALEYRFCVVALQNSLRGLILNILEPQRSIRLEPPQRAHFVHFGF